MNKATCIMVQGTMSGAGKRPAVRRTVPHFLAQDGYRVAPFKSQNMALNSFVTRERAGNGPGAGGAGAGRRDGTGRAHEPILLKPSSDTGSQVIVNGEVRGQMPAAAYFKMSGR